MANLLSPTKAGKTARDKAEARIRAMARLARTLDPRARGLPVLIAMTDETRLTDAEEALRLLPRGSALILRDGKSKAYAARTLALARSARARGLRLIVARDTGLAARLGMGGLHLPEHTLKRFGGARAFAPARRSNPQHLVLAAAHSETAIVRAFRAGADAVLLSPVFPTASHPGAATLGAVRFAGLAQRARRLGLGVYALGGITDARRVSRLRGSAAAGIAGIGFLGL